MSRKRRGRGEGSVHQRADGMWSGSVSLGYDAGGKRRRKVVYGTTKKEVQEKLRQLMNDVGTGKMVDAERITLAKFLPGWLEGLQARGKVKPTTALRYDQFIRLQLIPHLGHVPVAKLMPLHIEGLYNAMAKAGASADAQQKAGILLGSALRQAVKQKLLLYNPVRDVEKPRPTRKDIHPLDASHAQQFLQTATADRLYALYVLARYRDAPG